MTALRTIVTGATECTPGHLRELAYSVAQRSSWRSLLLFGISYYSHDAHVQAADLMHATLAVQATLAKQTGRM